MNEETLKLCMVSGSFEYESESSLTAFRDYVEREHPVRTDLIVYRSEDDHQSLSAIEGTDVLLLFTRRLNADGEELERLKAYCGAGGPIVGVRTASHAFQNWLAFDGDVLGGELPDALEARPQGPRQIRARLRRPSPPGGRRGVQLRGQPLPQHPIAPDTSLLMSASTDEHDEPVTWTRNHAGGRGLLHVAGAPGGLRRAQLPALLANAVLWCGGRI